jgi:hypothetical protein
LTDSPVDSKFVVDGPAGSLELLLMFILCSVEELANDAIVQVMISSVTVAVPSTASATKVA